MTLPNIDREPTNEHQGGLNLFSKLLHPDDPQFAEWLLARQELMDDKGWRAPGGEYDRYDDNLRTKHLVLYDESGKLTFGMRLTPMESYNQTLSWEMVRPSTVHAQVELGGRIDPSQSVWDLTRLTPGHDVPYRVRLNAIPRLFGEGLRECIANGDPDPTWVFTLDEAMTRWLASQDVDFTILGGAVLPGDTKMSRFGYIKPLHLAELADVPYDGSKASSFAHRAMRGKTT
jgi:hypothetical protein